MIMYKRNNIKLLHNWIELTKNMKRSKKNNITIY